MDIFGITMVNIFKNNTKGIQPGKPTKNFNVPEKYGMPIMRGMII